MNPLILAILLSVMQAPSPIPGKAANSSPHATQNVETQAKDNHERSAPALPILKTKTSPAPETESKAENPKDARQSVRVTELPSASVGDNGIDWRLWVFNGLLVIVGGLQVWLLFATLKTVNRQADIAKNQETQMIEAGKQTERIISQMNETTERQLRAYICVSTALLKFQSPDVPEVQVHLKNFGRTPAYDVSGWIHMWIEAYPLSVALPEPAVAFPKSNEIMGPNCIRIFVNAKNPPIPTQSLPLLGTAKGTIFAYGEVRYKDAFGVDRYTKYRLIYGGREGVRNRTVAGVVTALLKPDTDGNEAN